MDKVIRDYCSHFDWKYLPKAIALYRSLARHCAPFKFWVFPLDLKTYNYLKAARFPDMKVMPFDILETEEVLSVKSGRTWQEYVWTMTPLVPKKVLEIADVPSATYLDADMFFFGSPLPIEREINDKSIVIVEHRFPIQEASRASTVGCFNVSFLHFRRDENAKACLDWWATKCIEWCFYRKEDGKFCDQKYLDEWPARFKGVHALQYPGCGLAPWNIAAHRVEKRDGKLIMDGAFLIFYHFHEFEIGIGSGKHKLANWPIPTDARQHIYEPYVRAIDESLQIMKYSAIDDGWNTRAAAEGQAKTVLAELHRDPFEIPPYRYFIEAMKSLPGEHPEGMLDIGCGVGHYSQLVRHHLPNIWYEGCDFSDALIQKAKQLFPEEHFFVADVFNMSQETLKACRYGFPGILLCSSLVEVVGEWRTALERVLSWGSAFILLHRVRFANGATRTEICPAYEGTYNYRTYHNRDDLKKIFASGGYRIRKEIIWERGDIGTIILERN